MVSLHVPRGARLVVALSVISVLGAMACAAIAGIEDIEKDPPDGGASTAESGSAPCDPALASQTDPKNCGRCGRDCLGAACVAGSCEAIAITTLNDQVQFILLGPDHVYWSENYLDAGNPRTAIRRVAYKAGSEPELWQFDGPSDNRMLARSDTHLYWVDRDFSTGAINVKRQAFAGGDLELVITNMNDVMPSPTVTTFAVSANGQTLYFLGTERPPLPDGAPGPTTVAKFVARTGTTNDSHNYDNGQQINLVRDRVYIRLGSSGLKLAEYVPPARPADLLDIAQEPGWTYEGFAISDGVVYWAQQQAIPDPNDGGTLRRGKISSFTPKRSAAPSAITPPDLGEIHDAIVTDGTAIYFTERYPPPTDTNASIRRIPLAGGTVETLAKDQPGPLIVGVDDRRLVWRNTGTVRTLVMVGK
jgi:hypothetical protein